MHTVHGATRLALVPEDQVPIPPCCNDTTTDGFMNDDDNSLLEAMMQPETYECNGSYGFSAFHWRADQDRGRPREVSSSRLRGLWSGASLLDQNSHMTAVTEEDDDEEHDGSCKPPPAKVPRSGFSCIVDSNTAAFQGSRLSTVVDPIRTGVMSLADDFPSLSLFATRTNHGNELGTEVIMDQRDETSNPVSTTKTIATKPSMVRRQVTPCDAAAL